jgi:hypothetical protein
LILAMPTRLLRGFHVAPGRAAARGGCSVRRLLDVKISDSLDTSPASLARTGRAAAQAGYGQPVSELAHDLATDAVMA